MAANESRLMDGEISLENGEIAKGTTQIVAAFASKNHVAAGDLPDLIATVHRSFAATEAPEETVEVAERPSRNRIRRSIQPDHIVSFENGGRYKTLRRHLTGLGMTPAQYRDKWGLPTDYPMTAPEYSAMRSALAKAVGLGRPVKRGPRIAAGVKVDAQPQTRGRVRTTRSGRSKASAPQG
jgi:predicted transcriptional regulator